MKIIIVGAGRIGSNLASSLSAEEHEVFVIEENEEIAKKADEQLDVKVLRGSGTKPDILRQADVENADLVIAVTLFDEINMVVCSLAASFGAKRMIARVRETSLSKEISIKGYKHFYIHEIINPEEVAASAVIKSIETPGAVNICDFADGKILLRAFDLQEKSSIDDIAISDFRDENFPWPFLIVAIKRGEDVIIPTGETTLKSQDRIYVMLPAKSLAEFLSFFNPKTIIPKKVIIYGATSTGLYIAKKLSEQIRQIVFIEEDIKKAEEAAEQLKNVCIINGSGSEKEILKESGIENADVFIATSPSDHSNLISAVLAKKMGAKNTIIITHRPDYISIVDSLDIDVVVSPHLLAVDHILSYVRGTSVNAVTKIADCDAEALELIPEENSPITKKTLKEISLPKDAIIGAVSTKNNIFLARGDTQIKKGEKVIAFCKEHAIKQLQSFFVAK